MTNGCRESAKFLRELHTQVCFEQGDHPCEVDTAYSAGADAIERLAALSTDDLLKTCATTEEPKT